MSTLDTPEVAFASGGTTASISTAAT